MHKYFTRVSSTGGFTVNISSYYDYAVWIYIICCIIVCSEPGKLGVDRITQVLNNSRLSKELIVHAKGLLDMNNI